MSFEPSEKQIAFARKLGITEIPRDRKLLSKLINEKLGKDGQTKIEQPGFNISKLGYTADQISFANKMMDDKLNSIIYTIHHVTQRLQQLGIEANPQLVGMITKLVREEVEDDA